MIQCAEYVLENKNDWVYGLPLDDSNLFPTPDIDDPIFIYDVKDMHTDGDNLPLELIPNPPPDNDVPPLHGQRNPSAPIYTRNLVLDKRYRRGYYYSAPTSSDWSAKVEEADRLYLTVSHRTVYPRCYDPVQKKHIMDPIAFMTEMPEGVSFAACIDGDPSRMTTIGGFQTLESMDGYVEGPQIRAESDTLWDLSFGTADTVPFYEMPGWKENYRSSTLSTSSSDGSYSLASTVSEGQGTGVVQPAVGACDPDVQVRHLQILKCVQSLYMLIMPLCITKLEWIATTFRSIDLNVFAFGGMMPGLSSLQMNISSAWQGGSLQEFIGWLQGSWHVDVKDNFARWTLLIVQMRLPPGSLNRISNQSMD